MMNFSLRNFFQCLRNLILGPNFFTTFTIKILVFLVPALQLSCFQSDFGNFCTKFEHSKQRNDL